MTKSLSSNLEFYMICNESNYLLKSNKFKYFKDVKSSLMIAKPNQ